MIDYILSQTALDLELRSYILENGESQPNDLKFLVGKMRIIMSAKNIRLLKLQSTRNK